MCNNVESTLSRFDLFLEPLFPANVHTETQKEKKLATGGESLFFVFSAFSLKHLSTVPSLTYYGSCYLVNRLLT